MRALTASLLARFEGAVSPWAYVVLRIGAALLVLVRTTDWLAPFVRLDHHGWVRGIEYAPWVERAQEPRLVEPLVPGLGWLVAPGVASVLVVSRVALAFLLLFGVAPRFSAGVLAIVGWSLMAADRFRYLHHLHLLWVICALVALCPSGERLAPRRTTGAADVPRWPLQLVRLQTLVVYAASGAAKLRADFLDGSTLEQIASIGLVDRAFVGAVGAVPLSIGVAALELALVPLLAWRRTRVLGVVVALAFHATTAATMLVSTFPLQMALLLTAFLPWPEERRS